MARALATFQCPVTHCPGATDVLSIENPIVGATYCGVGGGAGCGAGAGAAAGIGSQSNRSVLSRSWSPNGPLTQVWYPSVKAVKLSSLRQTSRPLLVCWSASPFIGL